MLGFFFHLCIQCTKCAQCSQLLRSWFCNAQVIVINYKRRFPKMAAEFFTFENVRYFVYRGNPVKITIDTVSIAICPVSDSKLKDGLKSQTALFPFPSTQWYGLRLANVSDLVSQFRWAEWSTMEHSAPQYLQQNISTLKHKDRLLLLPATLNIMSDKRLWS